MEMIMRNENMRSWGSWWWNADFKGVNNSITLTYIDSFKLIGKQLNLKLIIQFFSLFCCANNWTSFCVCCL